MKQVLTSPEGDNFEKTLRARVNLCLKGKTTADWRVYLQIFIAFATLVLGYFNAININNTTVIQLASWVLVGGSFCLIGMQVMHGAGHESLSNHAWVNALFFYSLSLPGAVPDYWDHKHNKLHHPLTNILGSDDDIDLYPLLRVDESQKLLWFHKYQHYYCWILYCFLILFWVYYNDPKKYISGKIVNRTIGRKLKNHLEFWITKILHIVIFVIIPVSLMGWVAVWGYLMAMFIAGFILSCVFQCAHIVSSVPIKTKKTESFFRHQLGTTANFGRNKRALGWFVGGLNFQVEHHLFPQVCHIHYRKIAPVVEETCGEFGVPYHSFKTFRGALVSHYYFLKSLST